MERSLETRFSCSLICIQVLHSSLSNTFQLLIFLNNISQSACQWQFWSLWLSHHWVFTRLMPALPPSVSVPVTWPGLILILTAARHVSVCMTGPPWNSAVPGSVMSLENVQRTINPGLIINSPSALACKTIRIVCECLIRFERPCLLCNRDCKWPQGPTCIQWVFMTWHWRLFVPCLTPW